MVSTYAFLANLFKYITHTLPAAVHFLPAMAAKQSSLTLSKKLDILAAVDKKNTTMTQIAKTFGITKTTLSTILRNKDNIKEAFEQSKFEPG